MRNCQSRFSVFIRYTHDDLRTQVTAILSCTSNPSIHAIAFHKKTQCQGAGFFSFVCSFYSSFMAMTFKNNYLCGFHLLFFPSYFLLNLYTTLSVDAFLWSFCCPSLEIYFPNFWFSISLCP